MSAEIKPCPFCGDADPAIDEIDAGVWAIVCNGCKCIGPVNNYRNAKQAPGKAIEQWNLRGDASNEQPTAAEATEGRPRNSYTPLTIAQIDTLRPILVEAMTDGEGEYPAQVETICDMAVSSLLYGEEIERLRNAPKP